MKKLSIILFVLVSFNLSVFAHAGHSHKAPWDACKDKQKESICSYQNGEHDLFQGTCQYFSDSLMCVRNKPIIKATSSESKKD